ncbi:MAG: hypothetical protein LBL73_10105 [Synergistaceae bacterium]|jgi:hypothetical protein|nr:hypothetical protein [Synergistaceae bacterium]
MSKFTDFYKKIATDKAPGEEFGKIVKAHNVKEGATFADLDKGACAYWNGRYPEKIKQVFKTSRQVTG